MKVLILGAAAALLATHYALESYEYVREYLRPDAHEQKHVDPRDESES